MKSVCLFLFGSMLLIPALSFSAPVIGRMDDFEDGTMQGWAGQTYGTLHIVTGGPAGPNDHYLELGQTDFPYHIGTNNTTTWTGNYLAAGVRAIDMDVISKGPVNLMLRIMLFGPGGNFSTAAPVSVPAGSGWQHVTFGLTPADLVHVTGSNSGKAPDGPGILTDTLSNVTTLLIRHDPFLTPPGRHPQHVLGVVGLDNITAVLGDGPPYDTAWVFEPKDQETLRLVSAESLDPGQVKPGEENPTLLLRAGRRYQVTMLNAEAFPFEIIAIDPNTQNDTVLLSTATDDNVPLETLRDIAWEDNGNGTIAFTVTKSLYTDLSTTTADSRQLGYRCPTQPDIMRGEFILCHEPAAGDLNGDCRVDFLDLRVLTENWLVDYTD